MKKIFCADRGAAPNRDSRDNEDEGDGTGEENTQKYHADGKISSSNSSFLGVCLRLIAILFLSFFPLKAQHFLSLCFWLIAS